MSKTTNKYSPEVHKRAVWIVLSKQDQHGSHWSAILPVSSKIGRALQALNEWAKKVEVDTGQRGDITTEMAEKILSLERENCELRCSNKNLRKTSTYFAQADLDHNLNENPVLTATSCWPRSRTTLLLSMIVWSSGFDIARYTMARLIKNVGIAEVTRSKKSKITLQDKFTW